MADDLAEYVDGAPAGVTPGQVRGHLVEAERLARYWWAAGVMAGRRVLDVGCGLGDGSAILLEGGAGEVLGVDTAAALVEAAQATERPGLRFERADLGSLPYPDAAFEGIVCFGLSERGDETEAVLADLARLLAPGGVLAVSLTGRAASRDLTAALGRHWAFVRVLHQHNWIGSGVLEDAEPTESPRQVRVQGLAGGEPGAELHAVALAGASELPEPGSPVAAFTGLLEVRRLLERFDDQQRALDEQRMRAQELTTMERERAQLRARLIDAEAQAARVVELEEAGRERDFLREQLDISRQALHDVMSSPSWRITKPLRALKHRLLARLR
jgi:SAM-dependent methyltransferase